MPSQLSGVLTALATPFASDGQIEEKTLRRLVDRSIDGGVDGVVACGSTGEFAAMSGAERRRLVEMVVDQTAGRVPVVAQTGALSTREAVELSRHAQDAGASVLMVVAPYYEPLTLDETLRYLRTVADAVDIPIMLYNLPGATGVNLSPDTVGQLAREVENIQYIGEDADPAAGKVLDRQACSTSSRSSGLPSCRAVQDRRPGRPRPEPGTRRRARPGGEPKVSKLKTRPSFGSGPRPTSSEAKVSPVPGRYFSAS